MNEDLTPDVPDWGDRGKIGRMTRRWDMELQVGSTAKVPQVALDALTRILTRVRPERVSIPLLTLLADLPAAKDVIVLSPEEWERKKDVPGSIAYPAAHQGVVLYAA